MEDHPRSTGSTSQHDVYSHPSAVEHWRHLVEIVALVIAAVWGFYVFVYQERIKPAHEPPAIDVQLSVRHQPMRGGKEFVWIDLPIKNIGSVDVQMLGVIVNVYGLHFSDRDRTVESHMGFRTEITHTLQAGKPELLETKMLRYAGIGGEGHLLESPGEARATKTDFAVTSNTYDAIRVDYAYCFTRSDNGATYPFNPKQTSDGAFDIEDLRSLRNNTGLSCNAGLYFVFPL